MDGRRRGLVIGVDRCPDAPLVAPLSYAEQDARDLHAVLTDPQSGAFDPADLRLLVGADATAAAIKIAIRQAALESAPSDVLFLSFAGHGVLPGWGLDGDPYLATADLDPVRLRDDPEAGLRLGFLRRDVFDVCEGSSLLVLDCCHAGGYVDDDTPGHSRRTLANALDELYRTRHSRHSALLACPRDARARERADLGHGVFTHVLLAGLRGAAAGSSGDVTLEALAGYVAAARLDPPPGRFIQGWGGAITLTRPSRSIADLMTGSPPSEASPSGAGPAPAPVRTATIGIDALANPLDSAHTCLTGMLARAFTDTATDTATDAAGATSTARGTVTTAHAPGAGLDGGSPALTRIQRSADAAAAGVVDLAVAGSRVAESTPGFRIEELDAALDQIARHYAGHRRDGLGLVAHTGGGLPLLAVPLTFARGEAQRALVLVDPARSLLDLGEPVALMLHELWQTGPAADPADVELRVLTELRREFGRLPLTLYQHALELYRRRLESLQIVFEPVVSLNRNPSMIGIESWEALARDGHRQRRAPTALLDTAAVWGDEFIIERDVTLARMSLRAYVEAHQRSPFAGDLPKPLSINVAVRSVLSDAYAGHLQAAIEDAQLSRGKLMLEISEKDPVAPAPGEIWLDHPMEVFRRRLTHLASALHVNFAVDDFGVGHASLDRISALTLTQIKIDRAVLSHPLAVEEIGLVVRVAKHSVLGGSAAPRSVVMEGFDGSSDVSLAKVFDAGVQLVQGYITEEPASSELHPLGDVRGRIASLLGTRA